MYEWSRQLYFYEYIKEISNIALSLYRYTYPASQLPPQLDHKYLVLLLLLLAAIVSLFFSLYKKVFGARTRFTVLAFIIPQIHFYRGSIFPPKKEGNFTPTKEGVRRVWSSSSSSLDRWRDRLKLDFCKLRDQQRQFRQFILHMRLELVQAQLHNKACYDCLWIPQRNRWGEREREKKRIPKKPVAVSSCCRYIYLAIYLSIHT